MTKQIPQVNNMFLIGAGFTRAVFPNAPLNKDLLPVLCKGTPCTTLKRYRKEFKTDDIEILLTRLDLEITIPKAKRQTALQTVRRAIERQLAEYFGQFRFKEKITANSIWLKDFVNLFQPHDAIISLNYDCLLEGLLDYHEVWSPNRGYAGIDTFFENDQPENPKNILIYKIHGSENFIISSGLPNKEKKDIGFVINESIYPFSGKNKFFGGGAIKPESYIIAPSFVKIPHERIERIMIKVLKMSTSAKNLVIIGSSLRPEDSFLWLLLTNFLNQPISNRKLIIVDPNAKSIKDKIVSHYFVNISELVNITLLSNGLEPDIGQLVKELHENTKVG